MAKIHEAILEIQKNVPTLEKNGVGPQTQGSYKFLAVDDIVLAVRPLLDKNGVIVHAELLDHGFHYNRAALKEDGRVPRESVQAWVKYAFHFIAAEDGSEIVTTVVGEGIDTQDKAIRKATTSAWKIALIQTFSLATGEIDPDAQDGAHAAQEGTPTVNAAQAKLNKASGGVKTTAGKVPTTAGEFRTAILAAVKAGGDVADYSKIGERISGKPKSAWVNDEKVLGQVLDALNKGEIE